MAYVAKEKIEKQMSRLSSHRLLFHQSLSDTVFGTFVDAIYVGTASHFKAVPTTKLIIFCPSANALIICCS